MDVFKIYDNDDLRDLPSGVWGIKEPAFQYRDAPRTKGTIPLSGPIPPELIDPAAVRRNTAMDQDSDPLDVILIPGNVDPGTLSSLWAIQTKFLVT